jgi:hypothetical protein
MMYLTCQKINRQGGAFAPYLKKSLEAALQAELEQPMFLRKVNPLANCKNDGEIDTANG